MRVATAGLLLSVLWMVGCEERVVRRSNSMFDGDVYQSLPYDDARKAKKKDKGGLGDFLFGWTKVFEGEEEKPERKSARPTGAAGNYPTGTPDMWPGTGSK